MSGEDASEGDPRVGQILSGKYRVCRRLGQGGMGTVYEARHEVVGRRFALKFLRPELLARPEVLKRFEREARAAGALENENVAAVTDFGAADDGAPYLVMEFLEGEDLGRLLSRVGPLPVPRAVHAIVQACRGLEAAHAQRVIHRDLKPENLFVVRRGDGTDLIKILDFGIAKLVPEGDASSGTRTGTTIGTPFYMAPEQARGAKDVDHRVDIYALGVILYELLSGQRPHQGDGYNAILYQVLTQKPSPLGTLRQNLPTGLADVVHRAMAADPGERFQRAAELHAALVPFAGRVALPEATAAREVTTPTGTAFEVTGVASKRRPLFYRLGAVAALGILVAVAAGRSRDTTAPTPADSSDPPKAESAPRAAPNPPSSAASAPSTPAAKTEASSPGLPAVPSRVNEPPPRAAVSAAAVTRQVRTPATSSQPRDLYAP